MLKKIAIITAVAALSVQNVYAGMDEANKWIDEEFQPSALSKSEQQKEMEWFINAAKPFKGMEINVLSETIPTHEYESKVLAKAFEEITGISIPQLVTVMTVSGDPKPLVFVQKRRDWEQETLLIIEAYG